MTEREALRMALEALKQIDEAMPFPVAKLAQKAIREVLSEPEQDHTYGYAKGLAEAIFKQHFASDEHYASGRIVWGVNDTVIGILTQIDNMVADMVRRPQQPERPAVQGEPVAWRYALDASVEGPRWIYIDKDPHKWLQGPEIANALIEPLYTTPAVPERKPLTDEEIEEININLNGRRDLAKLFARAIEAAHGIRGDA